MTEGHIFIQGIISPWQDKAAEEWGEVNIKQVTKQIQDNADAEKLIVHIHSPGGDVDEGFGIHDILVASGKEIETRIEGLCASIATVIALAGSKRYMTENSEFMIHTPFGLSQGDADDMQKYTDQLKAIEEKILDFYSQITGSDKETISPMMKEGTWMTAQQAKELGFITDIITTIKAIASFQPKNINTMDKKELEKSIDTKFESFFNRIRNFLKGSINIKYLTVTTADGTILDFGSQVETIEEITVGMTATIEGGGVPEGENVMPDGATWIFEKGKLTEMKKAEDDKDMEALKAENEELKKQLTEIQNSTKGVTDSVQAIQKELTDFKAQIKSDINSFDPGPKPQDESGKPVNRFEGLKAKIGI